MEKSNRQIALEMAFNTTQGTYETTVEQDQYGLPAQRYTPPTIEEYLQRAETYLAFLEGDEVDE